MAEKALAGLNEKEFTLVMEAVIGGLLANPSTDDKTRDEVTQLVNRKATIADVVNISKTVTDYAIQSLLTQLKPAIESSIGSVTILENALVETGALKEDDIEKAIQDYSKAVEEEEARIAEKLKEAEVKEEKPKEERDDKGMKVVRHDSEATLEIKG